jgi:O-6-methylguanine DNA methyltransferase
MMTRRALSIGGAEIELSLDGDRLCAVDLPAEAPASFDAAALATLAAELAAFPLALENLAPFTRSAVEAMRRIPAGSAMTYRELASAVGSPRASRAIGNACAQNRLLIVVPCHRVLAESGLGGFRLGLAWKRRLLELESELAACES